MPNLDNSGILIYAQLTRENYIHTVFFELLDKAKELAKKLGSVDVNAVIFTTPGLIDEYKESFKNKGVNKVFYFEDNKLKDFTILLSGFYSTNNNEKIKQFIFDNCIDGIVFKNN